MLWPRPLPDPRTQQLTPLSLLRGQDVPREVPNIVPDPAWALGGHGLLLGLNRRECLCCSFSLPLSLRLFLPPCLPVSLSLSPPPALFLNDGGLLSPAHHQAVIRTKASFPHRDQPESLMDWWGQRMSANLLKACTQIPQGL